MQVFDFWEVEDGGPVFLVMELLTGETLAQRIEREGALPVADIKAILAPVAQALAAAHAEGIVHRDLKPENIFLARAKGGGVEVKVVDFGLARPTVADAATTAVTQTGAVMGTPHYMSPEQVYGERDIDARSDVWAFGIVMYECASGSKPFVGENFGQIFRGITRGVIPDLLIAKPDASPAIDALIRRALVIDRDDRTTMDALAKALAGNLADVPLTDESRNSGVPSMPQYTLRIPSQPPERVSASALTLTDASVTRSRLHPEAALSESATQRRSRGVIASVGAGVVVAGVVALAAGRQMFHAPPTSASGAAPSTLTSEPAVPSLVLSATADTATALAATADASAPQTAPVPVPSAAAGTTSSSVAEVTAVVDAGASRHSATSHGKRTQGGPNDALGGSRF